MGIKFGRITFYTAKDRFNNGTVLERKLFIVLPQNDDLKKPVREVGHSPDRTPPVLHVVMKKTYYLSYPENDCQTSISNYLLV